MGASQFRINVLFLCCKTGEELCYVYLLVGWEPCRENLRYCHTIRSVSSSCMPRYLVYLCNDFMSFYSHWDCHIPFHFYLFTPCTRGMHCGVYTKQPQYKTFMIVFTVRVAGFYVLRLISSPVDHRSPIQFCVNMRRYHWLLSTWNRW